MTLIPVLALQPTGLHFLLFLFGIGFNYTGLNHGFTARPDCAVHRPSPLGPRFALGLLAYLSYRAHVLTPAWLRSPYRSFPLDPLSCCYFSAKSPSEVCLRYVPSVARFLKVAFQGPLLWTLHFCQGALRCYDTSCLLPVFPCIFLGFLFRGAPRYGPRVPDVQYPAAAFFILSSLFPAFSLKLDTSSASSS